MNYIETQSIFAFCLAALAFLGFAGSSLYFTAKLAVVPEDGSEAYGIIKMIGFALVTSAFLIIVVTGDDHALCAWLLCALLVIHALAYVISEYAAGKKYHSTER